MRRSDIKNIIEAILFSYGEPLGIDELTMAINEELSTKEIELMLNKLTEEYESENRGIKIVKVGEKYQMCSNEDYFEYIKRVLEPSKRPSLNQATLETLVIIAYRQPITKNEIESIRGVKCDKVLKTLLDHNLIDVVGRLEKIGKPMLYGTTDEFLKMVEIERIEELPDIDTIEKTEKIDIDNNINN